MPTNTMTNSVSAIASQVDWTSLSGVILEGGYELKDVLDQRPNAAKVRVRILGSGGKNGTGYFLHLDPASQQDQLGIWEALRDSPHPNLSRPLTVGQHEVSGTSVVYMVLADADEKLGAVIPERPLEWEEAAEVLQSCEKGLAHLHSLGLLHGSLSPQTVEAVGYSVQLNTEDAHRAGKTPRVEWSKPRYLAPESKGRNLTTAADVWCLGATLFEVLSQEPYGTPGAQLDKGLPLAAVVQRCLDKDPLTRCTLRAASQMQTEPAAPEAVEATAPAASTTAREEPAQQTAPVIDMGRPAPRPGAYAPPPQAGRPRVSSTASRLPQPLTPKGPLRQAVREDMALVPTAKRHRRVQQRQPVGARIRTLDGSDEQYQEAGEGVSSALGARVTSLGRKPHVMRNAIAAVGLAAMLIVLLWWIVIPKLRSIDQPLTSPAPQTQTAAVDPQHPEGEPNLPLEPPPPTPEAAAGAPAGSSKTGSGSSQPEESQDGKKKAYYRVVLASFESRQAAVDEMERIEQRHPELVLRVSSIKGGGDEKYALGVGGVLPSADAEPLRERLVAKGLKTAHLERVSAAGSGQAF